MESAAFCTTIKILSIFILWAMLFCFGLLPLRLKSFKANPRVLSYSKAFSGGLFLAVGIIHLLPEAHEAFEQYLGEGKEHFPFAFLTMVLAFTTVLLIEKIIADDHHHHSEEEKHARRTTIKAIKESQQMAESENHEVINETGKNKPQDSDLQHGPKMIAHSFDISQNTEPSPGAMKKKLLAENPNPVILEEDEMEEAFKDVMRTASRIAKRITIVQNTRKRTESHDPKSLEQPKKEFVWGPYILQVVIGIHAIFEGIAIGIADDPTGVMGIAIALLCHKWAEGLTLGMAFSAAGLDYRTSFIMILINSLMSPLGIGIGWGLSNSGPLVTAIFVSLSAGTFLYISTGEVIVEEFSISRYKIGKFLLFIMAIALVCATWFIEHANDDEGKKTE